MGGCIRCPKPSAKSARVWCAGTTTGGWVTKMTNQLSVKDLIADARTKIDNLPAADMARALEQPNVLLVDLREPAERAEHGTIPGALAAPRGMLEFYADPGTP